MYQKLWLALLGLLLLALLGACGSDNPADTQAMPEVSGPALVMFYSDD